MIDPDVFGPCNNILTINDTALWKGSSTRRKKCAYFWSFEYRIAMNAYQNYQSHFILVSYPISILWEIIPCADIRQRVIAMFFLLEIKPKTCPNLRRTFTPLKSLYYYTSLNNVVNRLENLLK